MKWFCNTDYHPEYDKQEDFLKHMQADHNTTFDEGQFAPIHDMFRRPSRSIEGTCNLCMRDSKKLKSHVSRHLQEIALFALPRVSETAESDKAEHDTRSSRYVNKGDGNENKDDSDEQSSSASSEHHGSDTGQQIEDLDLPDLPLLPRESDSDLEETTAIGILDHNSSHRDGGNIPDDDIYVDASPTAFNVDWEDVLRYDELPAEEDPILQNMVKRVTVPGRGRDNGRPSLWDRAYAALGTEDPKLVENYEKVLSRELSRTSVYQIQGINRGR